MVSLANDPEARSFLNVVHESDGRASTREIRTSTELDGPQIHYRFGKLQEMGLIDIEKDESLTTNNEKMKIAVLTEQGQEEIDKGLLVETKQEAAAEPDLAEIAAEVAELQEQLSELEEMAGWSGAGDVSAERVERVEDDVEKIRGVLNEKVLDGLRMLHESVGRIEVALEANGIGVSEFEVSDEKRIELNERLDAVETE